MQDKTLLYTTGDSWTYGESLEHADHPSDEQSYKFYNTWPWHVKEHYNIPQLINDGRGGGSNARMYRRTIEFIQDYNGDLSKVVIIVAWSSAERTEIPIPAEIWSENGVEEFNWTDRQHWAWSHSATADPNDSDREDILRNVKEPKKFHKTLMLLKHPKVDVPITKNFMWGLQEICKANNIELHQFLALDIPEFNASSHNYDAQLTRNIKYYVPSFIEQVNPIDTPDLVLKCRHPNEMGYKHIANFVIKQIGESNEHT